MQHQNEFELSVMLLVLCNQSASAYPSICTYYTSSLLTSTKGFFSIQMYYTEYRAQSTKEQLAIGQFQTNFSQWPIILEPHFLYNSIGVKKIWNHC